MRQFNFTNEEHEKFAKTSPTYRKMMIAQYAKNQDRRQVDQDLQQQGDWLRENEGVELGRRERLGLPSDDPTLRGEGTGMYAEGTTPIQQFMMRRNFEQSGSGLPAMAEKGMNASAKLDTALLVGDPQSLENIDGGTDDPAKVATAKWFMSLSPAKQKKALEAWRADKYLDRGPDFISTRTGDVVEKDLRTPEQDRIEGQGIGNRLKEHGTKMIAADSAYDDLEFTIGSLNKLAELTEHSTVGFGKFLEYLPLAKKNEWIAVKDTILARFGLEELAKMKSLSNTGASGLGQLSEKELKVLQEQLASLRDAVTPEAMKNQIRNIYKQLRRTQKDIRTAQQENVEWYDNNSGTLLRSNRHDNSQYYDPSYHPDNVGAAPSGNEVIDYNAMTDAELDAALKERGQ